MNISKPTSEQVRERAQTEFAAAYKLQMSGHFQEAIDHYQTSIDIFPTAEAYTFLGWTFSFLGNYERAIEECKKAIEVDPDFGNPYNDIGAYMIQLGQYDEAVPYLEIAMKARRYASYHFPHFNFARILERKGLWFDAIAEYKVALGIDPTYKLAREAVERLEAWMN